MESENALESGQTGESHLASAEKSAIAQSPDPTSQNGMTRNERVAVVVFGAVVAVLGLRQLVGGLIEFATDDAPLSFLSAMKPEWAMEWLKYESLAAVLMLLGIRLVRLPRENLRGVIEVFGAFQVILWMSMCAENVSRLVELWPSVQSHGALDGDSTGLTWSSVMTIFDVLGVCCGFLFMKAKKKSLHPLLVLNGFALAFNVVGIVSFWLYSFEPPEPYRLVDDVPVILTAVCYLLAIASPFWFGHRHKMVFS